MNGPNTADTRTPTSLMDIHGVADRLGVTERHVRRLVAERRIPYLKWGHLLRFDPADIDAWLETARQPAVLTLTPSSLFITHPTAPSPEVW